MTDEQEAERGETLERLMADPLTADVLAHPTLQEVFADLEAQFTQAWQDAPLRDLDGHMEIKRCLMVLRKIKSHVEGVAQSGRLARMQIEERKKAPVRERMRTMAEKLGL